MLHYEHVKELLRSRGWSTARGDRSGSDISSASNRFPDGPANSSGFVGEYITTQSVQSVRGMMGEEIRCYKESPSLATSEHRNCVDKHPIEDFAGYCLFYTQEPLPPSLAISEHRNRVDKRPPRGGQDQADGRTR